MSRYANLSDWATEVGCLNGMSDDDASSYLNKGADWLDEELGQTYTIPFSSNNKSATSLSVQLGHLRFLEGKTRKKDDSDEPRRSVMARLKALKSGASVMVTTSGDPIRATSVNQDVWSTTINYNPVFTTLDEHRQEVDPDRTSDEENNLI